MKFKEYKSYAKINLFLHIVGKKDNGFHKLQTYFQLIDLYDTIKIKPSVTTKIITHNQQIKMADNLVYKAFNLWQKTTRCLQNVRIEINKNIPAGAGLGGASSNAAIALIALNEMFSTNLSQQELLKMALKIGADVSIFIKKQSAFAEGTGEIITPHNLPQQNYLLIYPNLHISTKQVFSNLKLTKFTKRVNISAFFDFKNSRNDCLQSALDAYPQMIENFSLINQLIKDFKLNTQAKLTGTGSSIFIAIPDKKTGIKMLPHLPISWFCQVVSSL